jgi:sugar lactone lactonase YvrE
MSGYNKNTQPNIFLNHDKRINVLQQKTIYAAYLVNKNAVDNKVLVKSPYAGMSSSEFTKMKEAALFFTPEELNTVLENNQNVAASILYAIILFLVAGTGTAGSDDGPITTATFHAPTGITVDSSGNMYVVDSGNNLIRAIDSTTGNVSTYAGDGNTDSDNGNLLTTASFNGPVGITRDSAGNMYIADTLNNVIRKISADSGGQQQTTTIAGSGATGFADGVGTAAQFFGPKGIVVDAAGYIYVADTGNNRIRKLTPPTSPTSSYTVNTIAGQASSGLQDTSQTTSAKFSGPQGLALDSAGILYIADTGNNAIRSMNLTTNAVTTFAGSLTRGSDDGAGTEAKFYGPKGISVDSAGNAYVADTGNQLIRKITSSGVTTTLFEDETTPSVFLEPTGLVMDSSGNLYITDTSANKVYKMITYISGSALPITVPPPPRNLVASAGTNVFVSWDPPASTGGAPIIGYTVSWTLAP